MVSSFIFSEMTILSLILSLQSSKCSLGLLPADDLAASTTKKSQVRMISYFQHQFYQLMYLPTHFTFHHIEMKEYVCSSWSLQIPFCPLRKLLNKSEYTPMCTYCPWSFFSLDFHSHHFTIIVLIKAIKEYFAKTNGHLFVLVVFFS